MSKRISVWKIILKIFIKCHLFMYLFMYFLAISSLPWMVKWLIGRQNLAQLPTQLLSVRSAPMVLITECYDNRFILVTVKMCSFITVKWWQMPILTQTNGMDRKFQCHIFAFWKRYMVKIETSDNSHTETDQYTSVAHLLSWF